MSMGGFAARKALTVVEHAETGSHTCFTSCLCTVLCTPLPWQQTVFGMHAERDYIAI